MAYIQRVASTARLASARGSIAEREKLENELCEKFSQLMQDTFERKEKAGKKPIVTREELSDFFKKLLPNASIKVEKSRSGSVLPVYSNQKEETISGYVLHSKFTNFKNYLKSDDLPNLGLFEHEKRHVIRAVVEPKYYGRYMAPKLPGIEYDLQYDFYDGFLHANEFNHKYNFSQEVVESRKAMRINLIKEKIEALFRENSFSSESKIETLQAWRYGLKDETVAYKADAYSYGKNKFKFNDLSEKLKKNEKIQLKEYVGNNWIQYDSNKMDTLDEKLQGVKSFIENIQKGWYEDTVNDYFLFPEKIKIVEEMLAKEIASVRANQKIEIEKLNFASTKK